MTGLLPRLQGHGTGARPTKNRHWFISQRVRRSFPVTWNVWIGSRLLTGFVSNGNATPEVLRYLRPWLDLYKVDLKSFNDCHYRELGGRLGPILDSIQRIHAMGFWLEIVTLIVPGFNDSSAELGAMAKFVASVSTEIPWHVTAFHPDYKMTSPGDTPAATVLAAVEIGHEAGLKFVYAGNLPNKVGTCEDTCCPTCGAAVIRRLGFRIIENRLRDNGICPECGSRIPGVWARPAPANMAVPLESA